MVLYRAGMQSSPVALWSVAPIARGIGFSMLLIVIGIGLYYNVVSRGKQIRIKHNPTYCTVITS